MDSTHATAPRTQSTSEVIALGELLVDLIQVGVEGTATESRALFARAAGGAPANVAAAAAALGMHAGFVGKVGDDAQGRYLIDQLAGAKVDLDGLVVDPSVATTLAFAEVNRTTGELEYSFARKPGADAMLRADELDPDAVRAARVLHVGTMSLSAEPARSATLAAVAAAREVGVLVSCDINLRPHAWPSAQVMLDEAQRLLPLVDLLKVSEAELEQLASTRIPADGAIDLLARGPRFVAVTSGAGGAYLATRSAYADVVAFSVAEVVDTAGAGDTFWGAVLTWLIREAGGMHGKISAAAIDGLTHGELLACGRYGCAAASLSVEKRGALGSAPTALQVADRLEEQARPSGGRRPHPRR